MKSICGATFAENAERVWHALAEFEAPLDQRTQRDLTEPEMVFQIGVVPNLIDS